MIQNSEKIPGRPADSIGLCKCSQTTETRKSGVSVYFEILHKCPQPSAFDHLLTFTSACHHPMMGSHLNADQAPCDPFYLRVHVRGVYKMWNKRQFKVRTTSRRATPLGDPRGVPKLFRKCSSLKRYRIAYDKFQDILHLKFESSLRFLVIGVKAKRKIYKVILDIDKMSDFVPEAELPKELFEFLSDFEVANDIKPMMDQFDPKELDQMLNNNEIDILENNEFTNINFADLPFSQGHHRSQEQTSLQNLDQVWTGPWSPPTQDLTLASPLSAQEPEPVHHVSVIQEPQTFTLSVLDDGLLYSNAIALPLDIMQPAAATTAAEVVVDERRADLQRRNNIASAEYRKRRRVKKEQEEAEVKELEQRNTELAARVAVMEEVFQRMRDSYFTMIRGVKRPSQEPPNHHCCCDKKPKLD